MPNTIISGPPEPGRMARVRLDLREHLAAARSVLSNERTFLAYQRTALTQLAVAATFIRFFDHPALTVVGWMLVPASLVTIGLGVLRYRRMRRLIRRLEVATQNARRTPIHHVPADATPADATPADARSGNPASSANSAAGETPKS